MCIKKTLIYLSILIVIQIVQVQGLESEQPQWNKNGKQQIRDQDRLVSLVEDSERVSPSTSRVRKNRNTSGQSQGDSIPLTLQSTMKSEGRSGEQDEETSANQNEPHEVRPIFKFIKITIQTILILEIIILFYTTFF